MTPGSLAIAAALFAAVTGAFYYFAAGRGGRGLLAYGRWAAFAVAGLVTVAAVHLLWLILSHQYQFEYVSSYSSNDLPLLYQVSALWAGQQGSFLVWALLTAWIGAYLAWRGGTLTPQAMTVILLVQASLLTLLLIDSPFAVMSQVPPDGSGLNPLLQNPWMAIHPPVLFCGYAGLVVPFAYAVAALWKREFSSWVDAVWPWVLLSWGFLGSGIALGGFWAYETLGWGGYWGWDPVENSSLVPWLTATALAHGIITQKSRGTHSRWNLFLSSITFGLVLYATYLTRSGVLSGASVHSFADSGLGPVLGGLVLVSMVVPLALLAWRFREIPDKPLFEDYVSRDFAMLLAILTLLVIAAVVLVGTSTPLFATAALRPDFYNRTTSPLALVVAIVLSVCPFLSWRAAQIDRVASAVAVPAVAGAACAVLAVVLGVTHPLAVAVIGFGGFAVSSNVAVITRLRRGGISVLGGYLAHVGVGLILIGIVGSAGYSQSAQLRIEEGQSGNALGVKFTFLGLAAVPDTDKAALLLTAEGDGVSFVAQPTIEYAEQGPVRTPHIQRNWNEDLYVSPGDYTDADPGGHQLILGRGEEGQAGDFGIRFLGFSTSAHEQTGAMEVAAVLQVTGTTASGVVSPTVTYGAGEGLQVGRIAALPGSDVTVSLFRLDADQGLVLLVFEGLPGAAPPATPAVASFEISRKPGINLLWLGIVLLLLGTAIAVRRRWLEVAQTKASRLAPSPRGIVHSRQAEGDR